MADYITYLSDSPIAVVTQVFGNAGHLGTDIQFQPIYWSNLYFPKAGTVEISQNGGSGELWTYGEWYRVACDDGTKYIMAHLRQNSRAVNAGSIIEQGQYAGEQGNTGNTSGTTGIHLHLEYFNSDGLRISPQSLMGFPDVLGTYSIEFGGENPKPIDPPGYITNYKPWIYGRRRRNR